MSKQLTLSAAFSILAMAAFALSANAGSAAQLRHGIASAPTGIEAPAPLRAPHYLEALLLRD